MFEISVIIISYNTRKLSKQCLESLLPELSKLKAEVIVVDNASTDGSVEMIRQEFSTVKLLIAGSNLGFGKANNWGARLAKSKYLLLLNSDTIIKPGALTALVEFADTHPDAGVVGSKLLNADGSLQKSCWRFPTIWNILAESVGLLRLIRKPGNYLNSQYAKPMKVDFAIGASLLIRREAFEQVGGFDEQFFVYAEETDLCRRLKQLGFSTYYNPASVVIHFGGGSSGSEVSPTRLRLFYTSQELYFKKYYGNPGLILYKAISIFRCVARLSIWKAAFLANPKLITTLRNRYITHSWLLRWHLGLMK